MTTACSLVWFRQDLRLSDNPALTAAVKRGPVVPVFIWDPEAEGQWRPGGASRWWLHQSLAALDSALRERGSRLIIRCGSTSAVLQELLQETGASAVFWNRRYEPAMMARDTGVKEALKARGYWVESFNGALLFEPWTIQNKAGKPFQVFTPFWRHCLAQPQSSPPRPLPTPKRLLSPSQWPPGEVLDLAPHLPWASGFSPLWSPGELGATRAVERFCAEGSAEYSERRNRPDLAGTSCLSPYLHWGEISPRQIFDRLAVKAADDPVWREQQFVTELGWREFSHHLLYHFPETPLVPLRPEFSRFSWRTDAAQLRAWQQGKTGYPMVDAGMRELWTTGWMHNRVRMIVASFLVKHLRLPWQSGASWFWDTLVDADLAQNTMGWQWSAGCGADAAPYFRIFNPITQGEKFDPAGTYIRRWIPELSAVPLEYLWAPWTAPARELGSAGVVLGRTYPRPIVDHAEARIAALKAFQEMRSLPKLLDSSRAVPS